MSRTAALRMPAPREPVRAAVLLAHGGREVGTSAPGRHSPPALRMAAVARACRRAPAAGGLLVAELQYRMAGYNQGDPVTDVLWGLDTISAAHGVPVVLIGHSMGARACLRAAGHAAVAGVAALAPWTPPDEPVEQLADRQVMLVHGLADRRTSPAASLAYACRARAITERLCRFEVAASGHAMLQRAALWHGLTVGFAVGALGLAPLDGRVAAALALPADRAVAVRI